MIKAFKNYIFVDPVTDNTSRIILPPTLKKSLETVARGTVIAAGPNAPVVAGEKIVMDKWAGSPFEYKGKRMLIIKPNSIYYVET